MLSRLKEEFTESPRAPLFWSVVAVLVLAQFVAFYMLCVHQVQIAQARDTRVAAQGTAIRDCLEFMPKSTIGSCIRLVGMDKTPAAAPDGVVLVGGQAAMTSAVPMSFAYR